MVLGAWLLSGLLAVAAAPSGAPVSLPPPGRCELGVATQAALRHHMRQVQAQRVVFFSSWCSGCREHVLQGGPGGTLLLGTFDAPARLTAALQRLLPLGHCRLDAGVARALHVDAVPAVRWLQPDGSFAATPPPTRDPGRSPG